MTERLYRIWCKSCNDWTIHYEKVMDVVKTCKECGTEYSSITLREIPKEKLEEQRARYKRQKKENFNRMFGGYVFGGFDMLSKMAGNEEIIESDAGQRRIDEDEEKIRKEKAQERERIKEEKREEDEKYKNLGRNDVCICGSGKKYKKCCLEKVRELCSTYRF